MLDSIVYKNPLLRKKIEQLRDENLPSLSGSSRSITAGEGAVESVATIKVEAGDRHIAADKGIEALRSTGVTFLQRSGKLVRIAPIKAKTSEGEEFLIPGIVPVTPPILERALGNAATWQRYDGRSKKNVRIDPPRAIAAQILDMVGEWSFPPLNGIIQCPTLRRNGSLLDSEGYDDATGLVLVSNVKLEPIADQPSRKDAERALALLTALLVEFPFANEASRSVALSMLMTPVLRAAMTVAPLHLATAPTAGTGKSYLADCASMIASGDRCAVEAASPNAEETEKRLVGAALNGYPVIALDNCSETLQSDLLCQVTERPLMMLRALGKSDKYRIPNAFTCFANGNNIAVAADLVRRTIRCAMDANSERPESREFTTNPLAAISQARGQYVAAILTIARAYVMAGRPNPLKPLASFEEWSLLIREPLAWLDCADPVATMDSLRQTDPNAIERQTVFETWKSEIGVGRERACLTAELVSATDSRPALREALLTIAAQRFGDKIDPKALGKWLSKNENTLAAKCKLLVDHTNAARPRWYLEAA